MVRLHVFSIKVSTPSCMARSALIISKFHVSKHVSNRHAKVAPQPEGNHGYHGNPLHAQVLLPLPGSFCRHSCGGEDKSQAHLMQPGWQNFAGL